MKNGYLLIAIMSGLTAVAMAASVTAVGQLRVKWTFNTSAVFPGKTFGAGHQSPFTVWDIDGDGINEIIWGTRRGSSRREWCIKAKAPSFISPQSLGHFLPDLCDGRLEWVYPPITQDPLPGDPICQPSLVDVNNDGRYEICIAGRGGRLHVINPDGTALWTWDSPAGQAMIGAPQAYDINEDGFVEFFMNDDAGYIHCVSHEGKLLWTSFRCKANEGHPTIADIDRDGHYEVTWACQDFNLYCMDAETGAEKWRFNTGANMETCANTVIDVNKDGEYEALCWNSVGQVYAVSCLGREVWRIDLPRPTRLKLREPVGDVDDDGSCEMPIMSEDAIYLYDIGGAAPVKKWEINLTKWSEQGRFGGAKAVATAWSSYHLIADINGDGKQEILWLVPFPMVTDADGNLLAYYCNPNVADGARQENGGWWGDVDKDGISEWIVELNGKSHPQTLVYCLTMDGKFPADSWWPEYDHSAYPASYQAEQGWLKLKGAYSNSLWFPMPEAALKSIAMMLAMMLITLVAYAVAPCYQVTIGSVPPFQVRSGQLFSTVPDKSVSACARSRVTLPRSCSIPGKLYLVAWRRRLFHSTCRST